MTHEHVDRPTKHDILAHDGVAMVGEREEADQPVLVVTVEPDSGLGPANFPSQVRGLPVRVETGEKPSFGHTMRAPSNRDVVRPVEAGVSVSPLNAQLAVGTLSFLLTDGDSLYISSNDHVFNAGGVTVGSEIVQPGIQDTSAQIPTELVIGTHDESVPPTDGSTVDMAWGQVSQKVEYTTHIHGIGPVYGTRSPESGDAVIKSGRTTGVTTGEVSQTAVSVEVSDTGAVLDDQVIMSAMDDPGDSGSPVMYDDDSGDAAGVIWGGSESSTVMCDIANWEAESGLSVVTDDRPEPENESPVADFYVNIDGLSITADAGSLSYDPDGSIANYKWLTGGSAAYTEEANFTYPEAGEYDITLKVTDDDGAEATETKTIEVDENGGGIIDPDPDPEPEPPDRDHRALLVVAGAGVGAYWLANQ